MGKIEAKWVYRESEKVGACMWQKSFTNDKITKDTYICSLHFVVGTDATKEDPDLTMPHC